MQDGKSNAKHPGLIICFVLFLEIARDINNSSGQCPNSWHCPKKPLHISTRLHLLLEFIYVTGSLINSHVCTLDYK